MNTPYDSALNESYYLREVRQMSCCGHHIRVNFIGYLQSVSNYVVSSEAEHLWEAIRKYKPKPTINRYLQEFYQWAELPDAEAIKLVAKAIRLKDPYMLANACVALAEQILRAEG